MLKLKLRPAALAVALCALGCAAASAADTTAGYAAGYGAEASRRVDLGLGKSFAIELPRDAKEVFVADPKVANAVVRSARQAYLIGAGIGQTSVVFVDANGRQIISLDVSVGRDLGTIEGTIRRTLGRGQVSVQAIGDAVVLSGTVPSSAEAATAASIAARYVGDPAKVVNSLTIKDKDQVLLKVTVAEVERNVLKQLGVDLQANNWELGTALLGPTGAGFPGAANVPFNTAHPWPITGQSPAGTYSLGWKQGGRGISVTARALEQYGVFRTLAEPSLSAISGESASFLAGGEFPFPTGNTCQFNTTTQREECTRSVEFKPFGVSLNFTPVVLSEGRISLRIKTEVSEISNEVTVQLADLRIPGLRVRRADTTVELPSGGSIVMAGLLQQKTRQAIAGTPGLMNLPVLGALFKSRDYQRQDTELAIFVTPYLARAVARNELAKPDDGFADASDQSSVLLGRLNRIYGIPGKIDPANYRGQYGFIID